MFKLLNKIQFPPEKNRMNNVASTEAAIKIFNSTKSKNLKFLLYERFDWMNNFIDKKEVGLEVGSGAGFAKFFIKNQNLKLSDLSEDQHLDFKNIDAQSTGFDDSSFDYVIASNMIHHVPYPMKFFAEMHRILKSGGKLIIQEAYCSLIFQMITIIMRHEGFDFTKDVWNEDAPMSDENDRWSGNIAIPHLVFDDIEKFNKILGTKFSIEHQKFYECFVFLNSGGVSSKTFYIPLNDFFLKVLNFIDNILVKLFPGIFAMGRQIVLKKL